MKGARSIATAHQILTPKQAVEYLGLGSLTALYRAIREHRMPYGRIGKQYRFRTDHLDAWMEVRGPELARRDRAVDAPLERGAAVQ